jgi:membrane-associated phospholipid phosphatase
MIKQRLIRCGVIVVGLTAWFWTQSLIGQRPPVAGAIGDGIHEFTAPLNQAFHEHPPAANALLIVSSAVIDVLAIFLLVTTIFGPSVRPFLGLLLLFAMRQGCQALCSLPPPAGMIWRNPGFPSLLVTYGVSNDLFFSGHTALAVYGSIELSRAGKTPLKVLAVLLTLFEVATVLVLRAHYTMDVVAGVLAALVAAGLARRFAPHSDAALSRLA